MLCTYVRTFTAYTPHVHNSALYMYMYNMHTCTLYATPIAQFMCILYICACTCIYMYTYTCIHVHVHVYVIMLKFGIKLTLLAMNGN